MQSTCRESSKEPFEKVGLERNAPVMERQEYGPTARIRPGSRCRTFQVTTHAAGRPRQVRAENLRMRSRSRDHFTLISTTPCLGTVAVKLFLNLPRSFRAHRSRTVA